MGGKDEGYVEPAAKSAEKTIVPAERPVAKAAPAAPMGSTGPEGSRPRVVVEEETGPRRFRYHENNGEIHFHGVGSNSNLKAAIPAAEWFTCWSRLARMEKFEYIDLKNKTIFTAEAFVENDVADVFLDVQPVQIGGALNALSDFTAKRR